MSTNPAAASMPSACDVIGSLYVLQFLIHIPFVLLFSVMNNGVEIVVVYLMMMMMMMMFQLPTYQFPLGRIQVLPWLL